MEHPARDANADSHCAFLQPDSDQIEKRCLKKIHDILNNSSFLPYDQAADLVPEELPVLSVATTKSQVSGHEVFEHGDQGTGYYLDAGARLNWEGDGREPVDARGTRERAAKRVRFD